MSDLQQQQLQMELNLIKAELVLARERLAKNEITYSSVMTLKKRRWVLKGQVKYSFSRANLEKVV